MRLLQIGAGIFFFFSSSLLFLKCPTSGASQMFINLLLNQVSPIEIKYLSYKGDLDHTHTHIGHHSDVQYMLIARSTVTNSYCAVQNTEINGLCECNFAVIAVILFLFAFFLPSNLFFSPFQTCNCL